MTRGGRREASWRLGRLPQARCPAGGGRRGVVAAQHEIDSNNARLAHPSEARAAASSLVRPQPTSAPLVGPPIEALTNRVEGRWFTLEGLRVSGFGVSESRRWSRLLWSRLLWSRLPWPGLEPAFLVESWL